MNIIILLVALFGMMSAEADSRVYELLRDPPFTITSAPYAKYCYDISPEWFGLEGKWWLYDLIHEMKEDCFETPRFRVVPRM